MNDTRLFNRIFRLPPETLLAILQHVYQQGNTSVYIRLTHDYRRWYHWRNPALIARQVHNITANTLNRFLQANPRPHVFCCPGGQVCIDENSGPHSHYTFEDGWQENTCTLPRGLYMPRYPAIKNPRRGDAEHFRFAILPVIFTLIRQVESWVYQAHRRSTQPPATLNPPACCATT